MNDRRHGRRPAWIGIVLALCGCGPEPSPKLAARPPRSPAAPVVCLRPFPGPAAASRIAWGGPHAARKLAVLWADGRFAVFQDNGKPSAAGPGTPDRPVEALALVGPGRLATGDAAGLSLWDISEDPARPLYRRNCGRVTAMAADLGLDGDPALLAGLADGRVLRFRLRDDDRIDRHTAEAPAESPGAAVASLAVRVGRSEVFAVGNDGHARRLRGDWDGPPSPSLPARGIAASPSMLARLVDGPAAVVERLDGEARPRALPLPRPAGSLAWLRGGGTLVVGGEGGAWIVPIPESGPLRPTSVRFQDCIEGTAVVAADPSDRSGRRLAIGDGLGRVEIVDVEAMEARAAPLPLDDAPGLAFLPHARLGRPRRSDPIARLPASARAKVAEVRAKFDRGETTGLASAIRDLQDDPALTPSAAAEVHALAAAVEQAAGGPPTEVARLLELARAGFARQGAVDRQADVDFWEGWNLARPLGSRAGSRDRRSSEAAVALLRRAQSLYLRADPPLPRQAHLCDAARAWAWLDLGDLREATLAFRPDADAARIDPVLGQVVELDAIAASLAAARGDRAGAAAADLRVITQVAPGERPDLVRQAALGRSCSLAALGLWNDAALALEPDRPDDPEWSLRRVSYRIKTGLRDGLPSPPSEDDPREAPLRARLGLGTDEARLADLAASAEIHRRSGLEDLAIEADLERAEMLERARRPAEAVPLFAAVARFLRLAAPDLPGRSSRPILGAMPRAYRGLARTLLATGRPSAALAAIEAAERTRAPAPKSAALGLPASEFAAAEKLRIARTTLERLGAPGSGPEADAALAEVRRHEAALSGSHRGPAFADTSAGLDPSSLGLTEAEAVLLVAEVGPEGLAGFLLRGNRDPEAIRLPIGRSELARAVQSWRAALGDGGRPLTTAPLEGDDTALTLTPEPDRAGEAPAARSRGLPRERLLHDALIAPFESRLSGVTRLIVVPGGTLAALPVEVLGRDKRLMQRLDVTYAPSLAAVAAGRDDRKIDPETGPRALILSPTEPPGLVAAMKSAGLAPELSPGIETRPGQLLGRSLSSYGAIHLAAPATLDARRQPFATADLRLKPGDPPPRGDGRLTPQDLASIPLRARVLTLAIEDHETTTADGLRDLARAGTATGARAVVLTLWSPPAASSPRFFAEFYKALGAGQAPIRAIEAARLSIARDPKFRDPVHWAGYVLYDVQEAPR